MKRDVQTGTRSGLQCKLGVGPGGRFLRTGRSQLPPHSPAGAQRPSARHVTQGPRCCFGKRGRVCHHPVAPAQTCQGWPQELLGETAGSGVLERGSELVGAGREVSGSGTHVVMESAKPVPQPESVLSPESPPAALCPCRRGLGGWAAPPPGRCGARREKKAWRTQGSGPGQGRASYLPFSVSAEQLCPGRSSRTLHASLILN